MLNVIADGQPLMDEAVGKLEGLRTEMIRADESALEIKQAAGKQEDVIRDARRAVDALRALAAEVDVQRATAESDLTHLAQQLKERHGFLTTQRQDLVDSIAQTNQAISKIDETTHARFREAFIAINDMLRSMMDKTQFIIITHSRKTTAIADRLYGVTMEEPGVSKLISIQLN